MRTSTSGATHTIIGSLITWSRSTYLNITTMKQSTKSCGYIMVFVVYCFFSQGFTLLVICIMSTHRPHFEITKHKKHTIHHVHHERAMGCLCRFWVCWRYFIWYNQTVSYITFWALFLINPCSFILLLLRNYILLLLIANCRLTCKQRITFWHDHVRCLS